MTIVDWRRVDARALAVVFARERARWLLELGWETRESWMHVERARTTWGLPGLAAIDDGGRVRGLTFFHQTDGRCDIGGVFAESDGVREALLDAAVSVCATAGAEEVAAFVYATDLSIGRILSARGFDREDVHYLSLALDEAKLPEEGSPDDRLSVRAWQAGDATAMAPLLHVSYDVAAAHRFVPDATEQGWRHYVGNLVEHEACGRILPSASRMVVAGDALVGAVLVTDLGPATAHIAQVAIHPGWRRLGLAGALLDQAARRVRAAGYARMTLLAAASNAAALRLYRDRGFVEAGTFIAATRRGMPAVVARAS